MDRTPHTVSDKLARKLAEVRERQNAPIRRRAALAAQKLSILSQVVDHKWRLKLAACDAVVKKQVMSANSENRQQLLEYLFELDKQIREHFSALSRNLEKSYATNDYGKVIEDRRKDAVIEFLHSTCPPPPEHFLRHVFGYVIERIEHEKVALARHGFDLDTMPVDGHQFEYWVPQQFEQFGWETKVTRGSGDQGIDVIASKCGQRLGIQCKLHSKPVGNKSVQEAFSGATHFDLDRAMVLSSSGFTPSAIALSRTTNVILLTPTDIPTFEL